MTSPRAGILQIVRYLPRIALLLLSVGSAPAVAAPPSVLPARSTGDVRPITAEASDSQRSSWRGGSLSTLDTVTVFHADVEALTSPGAEGGWTHVDKSGTPTAWHIAPTYACQGNAMWAGIIDSSWTGDPNRSGYDNNWVQMLTNYVDLTGAASPVRIGFKHRMNLETGYDFGSIQVFDPDEDWINLAAFTGKIPAGAGLCDTFSVQIPDSIIAKSPIIQFRFVMSSDIQGSSSDGLYPAAEGWSIDNVTVRAGASDLRFFDDMEAGMGTWTVSMFPPVGDFWHVQVATGSQQVCTSNTSKVWTARDPTTGSLTLRMDDQLITPKIGLATPDEVFLSFDVYRVLPFNSCMYYGLAFRSKKPALPWSGWINPTGLLYYGNETEWLRQNVTLAGAAGAESLQIRITVKDYSTIFCGGVGSAAGTALDIDNLDIRVLATSGPALSTTESNLFQDTFRTTAFLGNDNFNTPLGDSTTVRIGAAEGLQTASLWRSIGGGPFTQVTLTPVGAAAPDIFYGDVPAGALPRGTTLRYYFSATDNTSATTTLPVDAVQAQHYFTATILPASFTPPTPNCPSDTARVLYVNSYAGPGAITAVDESLAALGIRYDRYDVNEASAGNGNGPGGSDPAAGGVIWPGVSAPALAAMYSAIIWDVGERRNFTLTTQDQTLLQAWLATPGKNRGLLLAGDNLAYDLAVNGAGSSFLSCTAGAAYSSDSWITPPQNNPNPSLSGETGTRIALESFPLAGDCPSLNRFDAVNVSSCVGAAGRVWLRYPGGLVAGTERRAPLTGTDSLKSVLLGFSLGSMTNTTRRNYLLWKTVVEEMEVPYCVTPTDVVTTVSTPPRGGRIEPPVPNPFNPSTLLRFSVARTGPVRLSVYSVAGARVRTLVDGSLAAGPHEVRWDGKDDGGRDAGSGTYFVRLEGGGDPVSRKVVLLR